jgi:hypothetical protein
LSVRHFYWRDSEENTDLLYRLTALAALFIAAATAQDYQGPSIISRGSGDIGKRSGQLVELRFFGALNVIYDTGLLQATSDSTYATAVTGVEVRGGVYGSKTWRRASVGLDYKGDYRAYNKGQEGGSDQSLLLGYTFQKNRKLKLDWRLGAGSYSRSVRNSFNNVGSQTSSGFDPSQLLFDNRSVFVDGGMDVTYVHSPRTFFSAGGEAFTVHRQTSAIPGTNGYTLHGTIERRISNTTTFGVVYDHYHYDYGKFFGESNIDGISFGFTKEFDHRQWTIRILAGGMKTETEGTQQVALDPVIAGILGVPSVNQAFYQVSYRPRGDFLLRRQFKSSALSFTYNRGISPGNGVYLTSTQETLNGAYDYTTRRKVRLTVRGNYSKLSSIGQGLANYSQYGGGGSFSYAINRALHLVGSFDLRHQEITTSIFGRNSSRAELGFAFSPGDIPLAIW